MGFAIILSINTMKRIKFAKGTWVTVAKQALLLVLVTTISFYGTSRAFAATDAYISTTSTATVLKTGASIYFDSATHGANATINASSGRMGGYAWSDDFGWIYFGSGTDNPSGPVAVDSSGVVSGKAKFLNAGYIDFNASPDGANVTVSSLGQFSGYAWSSDLGWIDFGNVSAPGFMPPSAIALSGTASTINAGNTIYFDGSQYNTAVVINYETLEMDGYAWSPEMGWLYFGSGTDNPSGPVVADNKGNLSGKAKFLNGTYVDFNASPYGSNVKIASGTGQLTGYAWSEDLGWINFGGVSGPGFLLDVSAPNNPASVTATSNPGDNAMTSGNYYSYTGVNFSWTAPSDNAVTVDPVGVKGYYVYMGSKAGATPKTDGSYTASTSATFAMSEIIYSSTQYFRIQTIDNADNISEPVTLFSYNYYNGSFSLQTPASGVTGVSTAPEFRITSDDTTGTMKFKLQVCSDSACTSAIRTVDQTASTVSWSSQLQHPSVGATTVAMHQYQTPALAANTQYWWRAATIMPAGSWSAWSATQAFTTGSGAQLDGVNIGGGVTINGNTNITTGN